MGRPSLVAGQKFTDFLTPATATQVTHELDALGGRRLWLVLAQEFKLSYSLIIPLLLYEIKL
jgi:hypothetical protein